LKRTFLLLLVVTTCLLANGCTDAPNATRILTQQGYKDITITGWSPFSCAKDDDLHTGFSATSPGGYKVTGTVCSGYFFKASTIRLD
jgi:hypothetical protein